MPKCSMHFRTVESVAGHDPAALHQYTMLLECLQVGGELASPTLQQRAQLGECQYSSTGEKIMDL